MSSHVNSPIQLVERRTRKPATWDAAAGRWRVTGERDWLLIGDAARLKQVVEALGTTVAELLAPDLILLRFGNSVGRVELPGIGEIEVFSGKWSESDFEAMLADLMDVASALPFAAESATALPQERSSVSTDPAILYHSFVYLRHILSDAAPPEERLLPALVVILREPHRRMERVTVTTPLEQARQADVHTALRLLQDPSRLVKVGAVLSRGSAGRLAQRLGGRLPELIDEHRAMVSVDTSENRFVKAFLGTSETLIEQMRRVAVGEAAGSAARFRARVLADCTRMERALRPVLRHPLWREVGSMHHLPTSSTVLQRRRGYQDVFRHHARLCLAARIPLSAADARSLLEVKDISLLYEMWCFFAVARQLKNLLGEPSKATGPSASDLQLSLPRDIHIIWPSGVRLSYNLSFSRSARKGQTPYSVPLRPDITLFVPSGPNAGWHIFDAKFKLKRAIDLFASSAMTIGKSMENKAAHDSEEINVEAKERRGTFQRADLYKMHAYRDALGARTVWVLHPGDQILYFAVQGGAVRSVPLEFPKPILGVGALPLVPGGEVTALMNVIRKLLQDELYRS